MKIVRHSLIFTVLLLVTLCESCKKEEPVISGKLSIDVAVCTARIGCTIELEGAERCIVKYGETSSMSAGSETSDFIDGHAEVLLKGLKKNTIYHYQVIAVAPDRQWESEALVFETHDVKGDLSEKSSANCYIVSEPGTYSFPAVKGNGSEWLGDKVESVVVLWNSCNTVERPEALVRDLSYENWFVTFSTAAEFRAGNALIAAKDKSGNILWSWHIWICPGFNAVRSAHSYVGSGALVMDRNLGALSAEKGNPLSNGLLYQWGRKDPFMGNASLKEAVLAQADTDFPSPVKMSSYVGTIAFSVANPMTFIHGIMTDSGAYDWLSTPDNSLWGNKKTIYDPCPPGWKVPAGEAKGVWSGFPRSVTFDYENAGVDFSEYVKDGATCWYPCCGLRSSDAGQLISAGCSATWWANSANNYQAYDFDIFTSMSYSGAYVKSAGCSLRCCADF